MMDDIAAKRDRIARRLNELYRESQEAAVDTHGSKNKSNWTFKSWPCTNFDEMYELAGDLFALIDEVQREAA